MKSIAVSCIPLIATAAVWYAIPTVLGHGEEPSTMDMGLMSGDGQHAPEPENAQTYFAHPEHRGLIYAHAALMVVAWFSMIPAAVMLSLARSRYTLAVQFVFLSTNALGVLLGTAYNASTPDLYPNNAHHKVGWILTSAVSTQVIIGILARVAGAWKMQPLGPGDAIDRQSLIPMPTEAMAPHELQFLKPYRLSNDSAHGTEPITESIRSSSSSSSSSSSRQLSVHGFDKNNEADAGEDHDDETKSHLGFLSRCDARPSLFKKPTSSVSFRTWKALLFIYNLIDRTILILGFIALCTGLVTYGRFFESHEIFGGLAHWIKGGVFVWLGIFTLGRWCGSFGEIGWAWNVQLRQPGQKWRPSAEFVESALIFIYGSTNIFLEHLGGAEGKWAPSDFEHISITVLFIGGGLCGMLIESVRIRDLLNTTVIEAVHSTPERLYLEKDRDHFREPKTYSFSMNPIPALVILLLGIMMSSHTQVSMISSMIHKQWGNLLAGASLARGLTYVLVYIKPPHSVYPSRPPTELLTSFGLIAGGTIFMASASDIVESMTHYNMDEMFMYTVTMGLVGLLMAWVVLMMALKGWAIRREAGRRATHEFA